MIFAQAKWTAYPHASAPLVTKVFRISKHSGRATLAICGLGWYYAFLNGKRVGRDFYQPAQTDYEPRDLSAMLYPVTGGFEHRIYYNVYDVTDLLREGENELQVLLGNGFYRQTERVCEGNVCYSDRLKLLFELKTDGGEGAFSDGSLCYGDSFITRNNVYTGETQNFAPRQTQVFRAEEIPSPEAVLEQQPCPPDRVTERIICTPIARLANGKTLFDAGRNLAGRAVFTAACAQEKLVARYCEERYPDGTPDFSTTCLGSMQIQTDEFYHVEKGQTLAPLFSPHAFRYIEVEGEVQKVVAEAIATDLPVAASFSCSEEGLNWLFSTARNTLHSGFHGGIPVDCPHRERLGYTADGQLAQETALLLFDGTALYEKWLQDLADGQSEEGEVRNTAPFEGGGGGPVGWGGAIVTLCRTLYRVTGELHAAEKFFPAMQKWCAFVAGILRGGLVCAPREGVWFLGEWCTPDEVRLPPSFVNTCLYVRYLSYFKELCTLLNKPFRFGRVMRECRRAISNNYAGDNGYFGGEQGAELFAWAAGLSTARSRAVTVKKYERGALDTGIFGTQLLFDFLAEEGRGDLVVSQFLRKGYPSYGYWRERGATSFWETWRGDNAVSHNHPMFASPVKHLFYTVGGVRFDPAQKTVTLIPRFTGVEEVRYTLRPFGKTLSVAMRFEHGAPVFCGIEAEGNVFLQIDGKNTPVEKNYIWKKES